MKLPIQIIILSTILFLYSVIFGIITGNGLWGLFIGFGLTALHYYVSKVLNKVEIEK